MSAMLAQLEAGKSVEELALELIKSVNDESMSPKATDAMLDIARFGTKKKTVEHARIPVMEEQADAGDEKEDVEEEEEEAEEAIDEEEEEGTGTLHSLPGDVCVC
jgi:hypothetical protein